MESITFDNPKNIQGYSSLISSHFNVDELEKIEAQIRDKDPKINEIPPDYVDSELNKICNDFDISVDPTEFKVGPPATQKSTFEGFETDKPQKTVTYDDVNTFIDVKPRAPVSVFSNPIVRHQSETEEEKQQGIYETLIQSGSGKNQLSSGTEDEYLKIDENETKMEYLEKINRLRSSLTDAGISVSYVRNLTMDDTLTDIKYFHNILHNKSENAANTSMAEDVLMLLASGVEEAFDGKRVYLGRYRPDMTGWSDEVQTKLGRLKNDTSSIVDSVMKKYNISPLVRVGFELGLSFFAYGRRNNKTIKASDADYADDLRDLDNIIG